MFSTPINSKQQKGPATSKAMSPRFSLSPTTRSSLVPESQTLTNIAARPFIQPKLKIGAPNDRYEQEADRVADQVMRMPGPAAVQPHTSPPQIQRRCPECDEKLQRQTEEDEAGDERLQAKGIPGQIPRLSSPVTSQINNIKGGGQALSGPTRNWFEPRFGKDFSQVRIHSDRRAAQLAKQVNARAFTLGRDIVFNAGEFSPHTDVGGRLLAHELTHVVQQHHQQGEQRIQRAPPWGYVEQRRELRPQAIPAGLNYELQDHALIAHTTSNADMAQIADLMEVLGLYAGSIVARADLITQLTGQRAGHRNGQRVSIDVTPHLPAGVRTFLANLESYYSQWRSYVARAGSFEDIFQQEPNDTPERRRQVTEWHAGAPTNADEFGAVCHQFAMMAISGAASGLPGQGTTAVSQVDDDAVVASYSSSIAGTGPFRRVPRNQVRVGDIAVFRARRHRPGMPASRIIHSGIVIRVRRRQVELLEKTNPDRPMATRNVRQVLSRYSAERAVVYYLTPALQGMPFSSQPELGQNPPTEAYTSSLGTIGNEDTHVLFRVNTHVLLAHQDQNLFRVLATRPAPVAATIHGYASIEGPPVLNLNLSAHRAVTVKNTLARHMSHGTRFEAVAHGPTRHFGARKENRRAGIDLELPPTPHRVLSQNKRHPHREGGREGYLCHMRFLTRYWCHRNRKPDHGLPPMIGCHSIRTGRPIQITSESYPG